MNLQLATILLICLPQAAESDGHPSSYEGLSDDLQCLRLALGIVTFAATREGRCSRRCHRLPGGVSRSGLVTGYTVASNVTIPRARPRTAGGYAAQYVLRGEFIDRITAGLGQSVSCKQRKLVVDGQPSPWQPLHPDAVDADLQFTVPAGYYGILPSAQPQNAPRFPPEVLSMMSLVPQQNIIGPVWLRHRPIWRWARL